ncbi:SusD family protein [bacterium A37T11]|nr:SusD family protein [bacterium A37T11]
MKRILQISSIIIISVFMGCQKNWLEAKRDLNSVIPTNLQDYRSILNSSSSPGMALSYTSMPLISGEEFTVTDALFNIGIDLERNLYCWRATMYPDPVTNISDWDDTYQQVFNANVVLDGLREVERNAANDAEWDDVKGGALFFRAKALYNLAQVFAAPYEPANAHQNLLGIPLRLSSDPHPLTERASVGQTYNRIVQDLKTALPLLTLTPRLLTDASRPAAYALLARCFLNMCDYSNAWAYADSALQLHPALMNYEDILPHVNDRNPIPDLNEETLLYSTFFTLPTYLITNLHTIDTDLLALYQVHDLRLNLFFNGGHSFRGSYTASVRLFNGLASDELYLIRAECLARNGNDEKALNDLNTLLSHRFVKEQFTPLTMVNTDNVLNMVLKERRKELLFRGLYWSDLRRLNQEKQRAVTLHRNVSGENYTIIPNSSRYTMPIPEYIVQKTAIPQNQRTQE